MAGSPRRIVINNNVFHQHAHNHSDNDLKKAQQNLDAAKTTLSILQDKKAGLERQLRDLKGSLGKAERDVHNARVARDACAERERDAQRQRQRQREREQAKKSDKVVWIPVRR